MIRRLAAPALAALIAAGLMFVPATRPAQAGDLPAPPLISVDPDCHPGVTEGSFPVAFTFRLRNFTPRAEVTVAFGFDEQQQQPVVVGDYGGIDARLTFQLGASTNVPVRAFETANPAVTASTELLIPCTPTLRLTPSCDAPADPAVPRPLSVTVEGFNWDPANGIVNVALVSPLEDVPLAETRVTPDENRSFTVTLDQARAGGPLMALAAGQYYVTGVQFQASAPSSVQVDFVVPCPQLALRPSCGPAGEPPATYDIALSGSGFAPGVPAHVIFDVFGSQQVFVLDVPASGELRFPDPEEAHIRPFLRNQDGFYAVMVRQGTPERVVREAITPFVVPCPPDPDVFVDPLCGPPQLVGADPRSYALRVTGVNLPTTTLVLTFDPDARGGPPETREIPASGTLDQQVTVPARPIGSYQVTVTADLAGVPFARSFEFEVPCALATPTLRLRCDPPETSLPELAEVVLDARGFYPDAPLELILGGIAEPARTDANGAFTLRRSAGDQPPGALEASASQSDVNGVVAQARATLVLPCGTRDPLLVISPPVAAPGLVVQLRGFNFRPSSTISLRWSRGIGSGRTIDLVAGPDGTFARQVLIYHRDAPGSRELVVAAAEDPFAQELSVPFLVLVGSGSPPAYLVTGGSPNLPGPIVIRR